MSKLLRYYKPGQTYFVTSVTHDRQPLLIDHASIFHSAIEKTKVVSPFRLIAWVLIPDHFHLIIDPLDSDLSDLMKKIKLKFAYKYLVSRGLTKGKVWQRRFWDHVIRDEEDLRRHIDYIHYNPVKHGYRQSPFEWKHSSIHGFQKEGIYSTDWGLKDVLRFEGGFGE